MLLSTGGRQSSPRITTSWFELVFPIPPLPPTCVPKHVMHLCACWNHTACIPRRHKKATHKLVKDTPHAAMQRFV
jgi:hypothetical protein